MLAVNLLPPEEKRIIYLTESRRAVVLFMLCFFLVVAAGVALLLPAYFYSYFFRRELERSLAIAEQDAYERHSATRVTLAEAKKTRDAVDEVRDSLGVFGAGAMIMEKFSAPGEGITIESFFIRSSGEAAIDGRAGTRDQLLVFEEYLRSSGLFLEISFPLADLVRERDIRFSAHAKLKLPFGL